VGKHIKLTTFYNQTSNPFGLRGTHGGHTHGCWNCLAWLRIEQNINLQNRGPFWIGKKIKQAHAMFPWALQTSEQTMYTWHMDKI
jgi:hypothetical protein